MKKDVKDEAQKPGLSNLAVRALSAAVLVPLVLGAVWQGGLAFDIFVLILAAVGTGEGLRLVAPSLPPWRCLVVFASVLAIVGLGILAPGKPAGGLLLLCLPLWLLTGRALPERLGIMAVGAYLAGPCLGLLTLRMAGLSYALFLCFAVWGTDTGAYFAGRLIGGPKLLPKISPKKTWAGLLGGMALAALFGYGVARGFASALPWRAAALAAVLAVVAQAGDFFESWLKRRAGVKDSGHVIPGHGGVLDRVDGLLFAAAFLALYCQKGGPVF